MQAGRSSAEALLLTITEAAQLTRAPVATLRYWRHLGTGPRSFRLGRRVLCRRADIDASDQRPARQRRHRPVGMTRPPATEKDAKGIVPFYRSGA